MTTPDQQPADIDTLVSRVRVYGKERTAPTARAAACYARVSDARQESLPVQLDVLRAYAAALGVPIRHEFADEESGLITSRTQYHALRALARTGQISHVIVFHSSRWGRDDGEYVSAARELERLGVEFHATNLGKIDPIMVGVHAMIGNMEVRNISAHVLPNMLARARAGLEMGKPRFGYKRTLERGVREPDPPTFALVQELFARFVAGESLWSLCSWFNAASGMHKRTFGLARLLADPYYAGIYVYNKSRNSKIDGAYRKPREEWVVRPHPHPAVSMEVFQAAQDRLARKANVGQERAVGPQYPLTGLLWCAACQKRLHGQPDATGRYPFYHCPYCGKGKSIRKVEQVLHSALAEIPVGAQAVARGLVAARRAEGRDTGSRRAEISSRLTKLHARRARLTIQYADREITKADYAAALALTDGELAEGQAALAALPAQETVRADLAPLVAWLSSLPPWEPLLDAASAAEANDLYRHLIASVTLDFAAQTLTIRYTPACAELVETVEVTRSLSANFTR